MLTSRRAWLMALGLAPIVTLPISAVRAQEAADYLGPYFPYSRFDGLPRSTIDGAEGKIEIAFAPGQRGQRRSTVFEWIARSAKAITTYVGRFPVSRLRLLFVQIPGDAIRATRFMARLGDTAVRLSASAWARTFQVAMVCKIEF